MPKWSGRSSVGFVLLCVRRDGFVFSCGFPAHHQRNLWRDQLQLLLSGHQIVAVSSSSHTATRQVTKNVASIIPPFHLSHSSASAHKTPPDPHRHSKRRRVNLTAPVETAMLQDLQKTHKQFRNLEVLVLGLIWEEEEVIADKQKCLLIVEASL